MIYHFVRFLCLIVMPCFRVLLFFNFLWSKIYQILMFVRSEKFLAFKLLSVQFKGGIGEESDVGAMCLHANICSSTNNNKKTAPKETGNCPHNNINSRSPPFIRVLKVAATSSMETPLIHFLVWKSQAPPPCELPELPFSRFSICCSQSHTQVGQLVLSEDTPCQLWLLGSPITLIKQVFISEYAP